MYRSLSSVLVLLLSLLPAVFSQRGVIVVPDSKGMYESYFSLRDSVMRREIGSFSFTGSILGLSGKTPLREFEVLSQTQYTITLILDDIKVHIARGPFNHTAHRLSYYGPYGYVYRINGRSFWGFDGSAPERQIYAVQVFFKGTLVELPRSAYRDIFEPNFCFRPRAFRPVECHTRAFLSEDGQRLYIYMLNSRVPSLYEVCWIISDGKYLGRVVDYAY